jgi:hypothetical protein
MLLYLAAGTAEKPKLDDRLRSACVDYHFARPFPAGLPKAPEGVMLLGGDLTARRTAEIGEECARRGLTAALAGFGHSPALETARFCDGLLRRGVQPILTENAWQPACGAEMLISTALSAGSLRARLEEALSRCPDLCLDLERLCRSFPLPCPDGEGEELSPRELASFLQKGAKASYSEALGCKSFTAQVKGETRLILFDDRETLCRKLLLAAALGIRRCFLLYPEWSSDDASAAADAAGKIPAIQG